MPKQIQMVADVIKTAKKKGSSTKGAYKATIEYDPDDTKTILRLFHYGTLIYMSEHKHNAGSYSRVLALGGYSASDRDAIHTALYVDGFNFTVSNSEANKKKAFDKLDGWYLIHT